MKEIHDFKVLGRRQLGSRFFSLVLEHGGRMQAVAPGQFVEVLVEGSREVMLRRPISIHDVDEEAGTLTLLVQIVGNGTRRLAELQEGDMLNIVYPLGHGFSLGNTGTKALLVGGGAGIAPLLHLSKVLKGRGVDSTILLGGRTAELIPVRTEFEPFGRLCLATDDGSLGHKGLVVQHPAFDEDYDMIYTCGPTPMMKACGVGACLCCVTDTDEGHRCVCKDGPVFDISTLKKWYQC